MRAKHRQWSDAEFAMAGIMFAEGMTYEQIGLELGRTRASVASRFQARADKRNDFIYMSKGINRALGPKAKIYASDDTKRLVQMILERLTARPDMVDHVMGATQCEAT